MSAMNEPEHAIGGTDARQPLSDGRRSPVDASLPSGVRVQIRSRFDGTWSSGFEVFAAQPGGGYLVRRASDCSVLPVTFAETELRVDPVPMPPGPPSSWSPPPAA
jgi:hypothetical protein